MLVSGLPMDVIASVIVHNTNADHSYYNWHITRCRKSECKIGIDSISRGVEVHSSHRVPWESVPEGSVICEPGGCSDQASRKRLTNVIRSYTHQCDLPPEQPLTLKVDWVGTPVALLDTRPAVASS